MIVYICSFYITVQILHIPQGLLFLLVVSVNPAARESDSILLSTCLNTIGSSHWILRQPDQVSQTEAMARGTEVLFAATSDRLPCHPTKDGRATDSCFTLIGAHQCGALMVDAGRPAASKFNPSEKLVVSIETDRG